MASSTTTCDTGEFIYIDSFGVPHTVTNAQTFALTVNDDGAADVSYTVAAGESVTTTDGYVLNFRQRVSASGQRNTIATLTDAGQGSDFYGLRGELDIECPVSGRMQHWRVAKMNPSDADFGSAGTITMTLEDQFGNVMVIPATGEGLTVGQAA